MDASLALCLVRTKKWSRFFILSFELLTGHHPPPLYYPHTCMLAAESEPGRGEEYFPYAAYSIQRAFLLQFNRIAAAERRPEHANIGILESPTGTVSVLCKQCIPTVTV